MIYINSNSTSPYFNFALEEYLLTKKDLPEDKDILVLENKSNSDGGKVSKYI